ncbi:MAG: hypothetical protein DMG09_13725 [Acidobacteria bacterium]|nr:MAG: hypothetical protein DMG09_13725 [Acidobacteriota bacterium]
MQAMSAVLVHRKGSLQGQKDKVHHDVIRLGRKPDNHVIYSENVVSGYHAEIRRRGDEYSLVDLESTNGTFVNGKRVEKALLGDGDRIELGEDGPVFEFRTDQGKKGARIIPISGAWENGRGPIPLQRGTRTLGRGSNNDIVVGREHESVVSTDHAEIRVHSGRCELEDLNSRNGTFVNGERVRATQLQDGDRVELGEGGPVFEFQWHDGQRRSGGGRSSESDRIVRKLESAAKGGPAGDRTLLMLQAAQKYYKKRRWPLIAFSAFIFLVAIYAGASWYRERQKIQKLTVQAKELFYTMRTMQADIVAQAYRSDRMEKGKIDDLSRMAKRYDDFLEELGLYEGKTETQRAVMRLARRLGETDLEVPRDFYDTVMGHVSQWKSTTKLRAAVDHARQRQLFPRIQLALAHHGLPKELTFLALQESNFDATAIGPRTDFGIAKGMWQFIPSTAAEYKLKIGPLKNEAQYDALDERHDENKSTYAAAQYLAYLYSTKAAASGMLVIASYNYGQTRIIKRLDELPPDPRHRNFWNFYRNGWLPDETKRYVLNIFSAALICEKPQLFNISMEPCIP